MSNSLHCSALLVLVSGVGCSPGMVLGGGEGRPVEDAGPLRGDASDAEDAGRSGDAEARMDGEAPMDSGVRMDASRRADVMLPEGTGWTVIEGTELETICPDDESLSGGIGCAAVIQAWGGGIADTTNNRLLVWGGGHGDYWGNEIYAFDVGTLSIFRLTDPSPPNPTRDACVTTLPDGRPNSRHTYDNLAYIEHTHDMFAFAGSPSCNPGGFTRDTWTFDLDGGEWRRMDPTRGDTLTVEIGATDYDPITELVFIQGNHGLWTYDVDSNTYTELTNDTRADYHLVGRVDPNHRLFVVIEGGQAWAYDISGSYTRRELTLSGCESVLDYPYPGLTWDPIGETFVAWSGGSSVYLIDAAADTCEELPYDDGPGAAQTNGTSGRFRYFPDYDVFVLINSIYEPAYLFRLRPG